MSDCCSLTGKGTTTLERGVGAADVPCLPLLAKGSPLASVDSELQAAWQRPWCTLMSSGLVGRGLTVCLSVWASPSVTEARGS